MGHFEAQWLSGKGKKKKSRGFPHVFTIRKISKQPF
jgi:hypothetical protein